MRCYAKCGMKIVGEFWLPHEGEPIIDPADPEAGPAHEQHQTRRRQVDDPLPLAGDSDNAAPGISRRRGMSETVSHRDPQDAPHEIRLRFVVGAESLGRFIARAFFNSRYSSAAWEFARGSPESKLPLPETRRGLRKRKVVRPCTPVRSLSPEVEPVRNILPVTLAPNVAKSFYFADHSLCRGEAVHRRHQVNDGFGRHAWDGRAAMVFNHADAITQRGPKPVGLCLEQAWPNRLVRKQANVPLSSPIMASDDTWQHPFCKPGNASRREHAPANSSRSVALLLLLSAIGTAADYAAVAPAFKSCIDRRTKTEKEAHIGASSSSSIRVIR